MILKDNFTYTGTRPDFTRQIYDTLADMKAAKSTKLPQMYIASCLEDGNIYVYNKSNEVDEKTGKWRLLLRLIQSSQKSLRILCRTKRSLRL